MLSYQRRVDRGVIMTEISVFPNDIDSRLFMSDTDLENLDVLDQYQKLIRYHKYTEASRLLEKSDSFHYGASLFNMFEDRLYQIGQYVVAKEDKEPLGYYQTDPVSPKRGMFWIS